MATLHLFSGLPAESETREYDAGAQIFDAEDVGRHVFILDSGTVYLYRTAGRYRLIVAELTAPHLFGEMALVGDSTYRCSAHAITPARIRILPRTELEGLLERQPEVAR